MSAPVIHLDGTRRAAGSGFGVVVSAGSHREVFGAYVGKATSRQAEYLALLAALTWCAVHRIHGAAIYADDLIVLGQVRRQLRCRARTLLAMRAAILRELPAAAPSSLSWVSSSCNVAHSVAALAVESKTPLPTWWRYHHLLPAAGSRGEVACA